MQRQAGTHLLLTAKQLWQMSATANSLQLQRSMAIVVNVNRNNVDRAYAQLQQHFKEAGMREELKNREYRKTSAEEKFNAKRAIYNKRMGMRIADRLKWVIRRRKLKI